MLKSIIDDVRTQFDYGNKVTQLVIVNVAVFVLMNLINLGFTVAAGFKPSVGFVDVLKVLSINPDLSYNATHPWVIITHMFLHVGFFHVLFNMLILYWFGRIVGDLIGDRHIVPLYLMSGLFGALIYLLTAPLVPSLFAHGASASVMGIVIAAALLAPNYLMHLLLLGEVKLKYVALGLIFLDLIGIGSLDNTGGRFAHLGGVAFGIFFVALLRQGRDISAPVNTFFDWVKNLFVRRRPAPKRSPHVYVRHSSVSAGQQRKSESVQSSAGRKTARPEANQRDHQQRLDAILDKIKQRGYESLTQEEKEFLFNASKH